MQVSDFFETHHGDIDGLRLVILNALRETIYEQSRALNATAYFGALVMSIDRPDSLQAQNAERVGAMVYLLSLALPRVPPAIVRQQTPRVSPLLMGIATAHKAEQAALKPAISCMGTMLRVADHQLWSEQSTVMSIFEGLLSLSIDVRPKVCKAAQQVILQLWGADDTVARKAATVRASVGSVTAKFLGTVLARGKTATGADQIEQLVQGLVLLKPIWAKMKPKPLVALATCVLQLRERNQATIQLFCVQALEGLFSNMSNETVATSTAGKLLEAATSWMPSEGTVDLELVKAHFKLLSASFAFWAKLDSQECEQRLPSAIGAIARHLGSHNPKVSAEAVGRLGELMQVAAPIAKRAQAPAHCLQPLLEPLKAAVKGLELNRLVPALNVYQALFQAVGTAALPALAEVLLGVAKLRNSPGGSASPKLCRAVHRVVGAAIESTGPEAVLQLLPLGVDAETGVTEHSQTWLIPLLANHVRNGSLQWFGVTLISLANGLLASAERAAEAGLEVAGRNMQLIALQLWGLLPAFCRTPIDVVQSFPGMAKVLGLKISEGGEIAVIVCNSLAVLIEDARNDNSDAGNAAVGAIKPFAANFLPVLFNLFLSAHAADHQQQIEASKRGITAYCAISPQAAVSEFFKGTVHKILQAGAPVELQSNLTELALVLVVFLDFEAAELLFKVVEPMLMQAEPTMMKKAYKVLLALAEHQPSFVNSRLERLQQIVTSTAAMCSNTAKKNRIMCLRQIALAVDVSMLPGYLAAVLPEVILCVRETNFKAREAAYEFIVTVAHKVSAHKKTSKLVQSFEFPSYVTLLCAGLGGKSPMMVAATMMALSRLVFEFGAQMGDMLPMLCQMAGTMLADHSKEIIKAVLAFLKVSIQSLPAEMLEPQLEGLIEALLPWATAETESNKNEIRLKVKILFERLLRKFGFDLMNSYMPAQHQKLLQHIQKMVEREKRKKDGDRRRKREAAMDNNAAFEELATGAGADNDDADIDMESGMAADRPKAGADEDSDHELDMHISAAGKGDSGGQKRKKRGRAEESTGAEKEEFRTGRDGRIEIAEPVMQDDYHEDPEDGDLVRATPGASRSVKRAKRTEKQVYKHTGTEFKAKRAGGDLMNNGQQPFAYLPMDHRMLNKKKKHKAARSLKQVLKGGNKGAGFGSFAKTKQGRKR